MLVTVGRDFSKIVISKIPLPPPGNEKNQLSETAGEGRVRENQGLNKVVDALMAG
jgi:hypothetical protein